MNVGKKWCEIILFLCDILYINLLEVDSLSPYFGLDFGLIILANLNRKLKF